MYVRRRSLDLSDLHRTVELRRTNKAGLERQALHADADADAEATGKGRETLTGR